ncbi:MAG: dTMP kinase [Rikenellaceae bacterium]
MFIVIEGLDGAGKSTQVSLITEELKKQGLECEYLHFPRFSAPIYGELISKFLRGDLGAIDEVDPYLVALIYAGDRKDASAQIEKWLAEGKCVIVDRYVYSNIAYQCAKVKDVEGRKVLYDWILNLEYEFNKIVKPDTTIFLDVPFKFTEKKLTEERTGEDRDYLQGKKDIHEASLDFQQFVREVYLDASQKDENLKVIDCSDAEGGMLLPNEIFEKIKSVVKF